MGALIGQWPDAQRYAPSRRRLGLDGDRESDGDRSDPGLGRLRPCPDDWGVRGDWLQVVPPSRWSGQVVKASVG